MFVGMVVVGYGGLQERLHKSRVYRTGLSNSMPHCPRCSKNFTDISRVLRHLNQPASNCLAYHQEVESKNKAFAAAHTHDPSFPPNAMVDHPTQDPGAMPDADNLASNIAMDVDDAELHTSTPPNPISNPPFFETYPGAAKVFGRGKTLMDIFDTDRYADKRTELPYYPFASKAEWGLVSFLLRSDLSMKSIDQFLKLELVSKSLAMPFLMESLTIISDCKARPFVSVCKGSS